jgi:hypothetical protein
VLCIHLKVPSSKWSCTQKEQQLTTFRTLALETHSLHSLLSHEMPGSCIHKLKKTVSASCLLIRHICITIHDTWFGYEAVTQCFLPGNFLCTWNNVLRTEGKGKSALVRALSLYGLPDLRISFQANKDLWTGCRIVPPKTPNNANIYHKTLISCVSAPVSCLKANLYYCDTGNAIQQLWYSVLNSFCHTNWTLFQYFKECMKIWDENGRYVLNISLRSLYWNSGKGEIDTMYFIQHIVFHSKILD